MTDKEYYPLIVERMSNGLILCREIRGNIQPGIQESIQRKAQSSKPRRTGGNRGVPIRYEVSDVNKAFEEICGLKKDLVIDKKLEDILPGVDLTPIAQAAANASGSAIATNANRTIAEIGGDVGGNEFVAQYYSTALKKITGSMCLFPGRGSWEYCLMMLPI